jgi:hypothetical protein
MPSELEAAAATGFRRAPDAGGPWHRACIVTVALTVAVLGFIGFRLVGAARFTFTRGRSLALDIVRGISWRHIWPVPFVLGAVLVVATLLLMVPGLDFGWWTALGGEGNPVMGSTSQTSGTVFEWLVPAVFLVLLAPAVPILAFSEEELFRRGAERWTTIKRIGWCLLFGLAHLVIGVPIAVALALSIGGAYFVVVYLRGFRANGGDQDAACLESARAHTVYNLTIILLVAGLLVTGNL